MRLIPKRTLPKPILLLSSLNFTPDLSQKASNTTISTPIKPSAVMRSTQSACQRPVLEEPHNQVRLGSFSSPVRATSESSLFRHQDANIGGNVATI